MNTRQTAILTSFLLAGLLTGGCLEKDASQSICLEPDGSATWTVVERDVHATGGTPAARLREEDGYLAAARLGQHPAARAFGALHAFDVRTDIIRDEWPFVVCVRGRFPDLALLWQDILNRLGMSGESRVERQGARMAWTMTARDTGTADQTTDEAEAFQSLLGGGRLRVFIRHGRFVEATGFDISDDGRVATLKEDLEEIAVESADGTDVVRLSLTWTDAESSGS